MQCSRLELFVSGISFLLLAASLGLPSASADDDEQQQLELLKTFNSEFVSITPGEKGFPKSFRMGTENGSPAEGPAHEVSFAYSFAIAKYEVPQNLYEAVKGENPSKWKGKRNSVEMFDIWEAVEFCSKATMLMRAAKLLTEDEEIRLPSEAEWEYCCRAGTKTAYSFGDSAVKPGDAGNDAGVLNQFAWHTGNAAGNDPPVGAKKPNAWGLYDMHGYLWEFVSDEWHDTYAEAPTDGSSWTKGDAKSRRVIRGGSWKDRHEALRSAHRRPIADDAKDDAVGLRCVKAKMRQ